MAAGEARILRARRHELTEIVVVRPACVLHHDGRTYAEGDVVRLSLEDARRLEERGVVSRPG
jgi:hypothetical protein